MSLPPHSREILNPRINSFKKDLKSLNSKFSNLKQKLNESALFGEKFDIESSGGGTDHRQDKRMRQVAKNNQKLDEALSVGYAAETTAKDIKLGLHSNSEKLNRAGDNVHRINGQLSVSNRLIDVMQRHETKNKIIIYCVALVLILGIVAVLYFTLFK